MTTTTATTTSTSLRTYDLWKEAHCALVAREWRMATRLMRLLADCQDGTRRMLSPELYEHVNRPLSAELIALFGRVNAIAQANRNASQLIVDSTI